MFWGHCGQLNADGLRFCTSCGADLAGQTPAGTPTGRTPSSDMSGGQTLISPNAGTPAGITISGGQTLASPTPSTPGWDMDAGASSLGLRHGDVVADRFEVVALLGQGGMGAVFKVQDTEQDTIWALKVIRPETI